jgi:hypothetical protein
MKKGRKLCSEASRHDTSERKRESRVGGRERERKTERKNVYSLEWKMGVQNGREKVRWGGREIYRNVEVGMNPRRCPLWRGRAQGRCHGGVSLGTGLLLRAEDGLVRKWAAAAAASDIDMSGCQQQ